MSITQNINFMTSKAVEARPDFYTAVTLDVDAVLKSWQLSVFSFEWMDADGNIKSQTSLKDSDRSKREGVEAALEAGRPLEIPVLGIGIQDNIEIGSGKAVLCTLAAHGVKTVPAHIPKSNESDFKPLVADV